MFIVFLHDNSLKRILEEVQKFSSFLKKKCDYHAAHGLPFSVMNYFHKLWTKYFLELWTRCKSMQQVFATNNEMSLKTWTATSFQVIW